MKVAIFGAGGHIGAACCHHYSGHHDVIAYVRSERPYPALEALDVDIRHHDVNLLTAADYADFDLVVDCAAPYPVTMNDNWRRIVTEEGLRFARLGDLLGESTRYVYVSSFVTLPRRRSWQSLGNSLGFSHPYYATKLRLEKTVAALQRRHTGITIVNPSACFGPWDSRPSSLCFIPRLAAGEIPVVADRLINIVDVRDVAQAIDKVAETGGRHALFGQALRLQELVAACCKTLARNAPPTVSIPGLVSNAAFAVAEGLNHISNRDVVIPALPVMLISESYELQTTAAPISARPMAETLNDAIDWYRSLNYL